MKLAVAAALAMALNACGDPPKLRVDQAVLVLSPVDSNPSALYFTVHGGTEDVKLLRVVSPSIIRSEIHESGKDPKTGMMTMTPLTSIPVAARSKVEFKKGGKHVMIWGVNLRARRLGEMETEYIFSNGDRILVNAIVEEADGTIPDERKKVT
ncbi:MAG: copper chaperone PCu(A)C [Sphingomonadales bacterium]|nr:copper chaperone PCu(A)C [Sphingomonadales bacterium]